MPLSRGAGRGGKRVAPGRRQQAGSPPTFGQRILEIFRLLDTTNWVTRTGDYRSLLSGVISLVILVVFISWLSVQFSTKAYIQTDASCTCLPLDEVRVDGTTYKIQSFPEVYTRKVCPDHAEGQFCSEDCLKESTTNFMSELCDPGTYGCQCLPDGTCSGEGYQCLSATNECGLPPDTNSFPAYSNESLAVWEMHKKDTNSSVAVEFCVQEFKRKVAGILALLGLPDSEVELTDEEMAHFRKSAVCVASWNACVLPVTPVQQLNIIGSTWGWATLFILPLLMSINCYLKSKYHGLGAPDYADNDAEEFLHDDKDV